ncbi:MAG TPA: sulfur carrier protein ThiS [Spirochaetota bacterium]|nr:sulfur carrier protein ThiS [Spirochaetota bacterium]HPJ36939.1 sulfur carrier protein ThiS [Spirochaetota bacterium]HPQ52511.1 sulfur carrier protein ThiS [Spirochaetota bacterium]
MKITVNSREMVFYKSTLQELIDQYKMNPDKISVNKNGEVIEKSSFRTEILQEGDVLDIGRRR